MFCCDATGMQPTALDDDSLRVQFHRERWFGKTVDDKGTSILRCCCLSKRSTTIDLLLAAIVFLVVNSWELRSKLEISLLGCWTSAKAAVNPTVFKVSISMILNLIPNKGNKNAHCNTMIYFIFFSLSPLNVARITCLDLKLLRLCESWWSIPKLSKMHI